MTAFYFRIVHEGSLLRGSEHSFEDIHDPELSDHVDRLTEQVAMLITATDKPIEIQIFDLSNPTSRYTIERKTS